MPFYTFIVILFMSIFIYLFDCLSVCGHDDSENNENISRKYVLWVMSGSRNCIPNFQRSNLLRYFW